MPRGNKCPFCGTLTLHIDGSGSFRKCSDCKFVGWWLTDPVSPGKGKGYTCVNCHRSTLHSLAEVAGVEMLRCSFCLYSGIRPIKSGSVEQSS